MSTEAAVPHEAPHPPRRSRVAEAWLRYVDFLREREAPDALALGRIVFGLAVIANVLEQIFYTGVMELYGNPSAGGVFAFSGKAKYSLFALVDPTPEAVWAVVLLTLIGGVTFTLGLFTRLSSLVLFVCHMTLMARMGWFNFSSDNVYRVFSFLMLISPVGAAWSLDAKWRGKGKPTVPMWPRRLLIAQLTIVYVKTGLMKVGSTWSIDDRWSALYYSLNLPYFAWFPGEWLASEYIYPFTQVATFVARWWETLFFLVPLGLYLRRNPTSGGRLRRMLAAIDWRLVFMPVGVLLHASLVVVMKLGMFPFVMVSLYPFVMEPAEARRVLNRVFRRWL